MNSTYREIIKLIVCSIKGKYYTYNPHVDYNKILKITVMHGIVNTVYNALFTSSEVPEDIKLIFKREFAINTSVSVTQEYYTEAIKNALIKNKTDFAYLKGVAIKGYYPEQEMRQMNDLDILYRNGIKEVKYVLRELGLELRIESDIDDHYFLPPHLNVEMHKKPTEIESMNRYYSDIFDRLKKFGSYEYKFPLKELILFTVIHAYRHILSGGIGVRFIIDLYLLNRKLKEEDETYLFKELTKLGLKDFYDRFSELSLKWFDGEIEKGVYTDLTDFLFESGAFGSTKNVAVKGASNGKKSYILHRLFPSKKELTVNYPVLKKCALLLPIIWIIRLFKALFTKPEKMLKEKNDVKKVTDSEIEKRKQLFLCLGIKERKD